MPSKGYEGFETWSNALRMTVKMHFQIFIALFVFQVLTFVFIIWLLSDPYSFKTTAHWVFAKFVSWISPGVKMRFLNSDGTTTLATAYSIVNTASVKSFAVSNLLKTSYVAVFSFAVYLLYPLVLLLFKRRAKHQSDKSYVRGGNLISTKEYERLLKKRGESRDLPVGSVCMPKSAETKHTFIVGRPGVGKTVMLCHILERLKKRGEKAIVYDFKGEYLSKFYEPGKDFIFNPLDKRSLGWNIFNELESFMDVDAVAASLIPPPIATIEPFWPEAARDVFAGILHYLLQNGGQNNRHIWQMVTAEGRSIADNLKNTKGGERGYRYIEDASSKQALSVFATMMQYVKCFEFMAKNDGDFCINDWLSDDDRGMIFITNYSNVEDTLRPILSLFVDLLGRKLLSMPDSQSRRIFFMLDEFGTLQRLSSILKLLTLSRSKGGCVFLGIQDLGQIQKLYSRDHRQSIVNSCGTSVIFSVADTETARYCSEKIGETEYMHGEKTLSMGVDDIRDGTSLSIRKKREPLFLPSDIANLAELTGIVKFPNYHHLMTKFEYKRHAAANKEFEPLDALLIDNVIIEQEAIKRDLDNLKIDFEGV
jgi:type IV conjugative transfer system coupling protein TraD